MGLKTTSPYHSPKLKISLAAIQAHSSESCRVYDCRHKKLGNYKQPKTAPVFPQIYCLVKLFEIQITFTHYYSYFIFTFARGNFQVKEK